MRAWGPAAVWAAVLFLLSAWPSPGIPQWVMRADRYVHLAVYAVLGASLGYWKHRGSTLPHVVLLGLGVLYGATDEWHQAYVNGRRPVLMDWFADVAGVFLGYGIAWLFLAWRARRAAQTVMKSRTDGSY